jgi:hypothetical protein
MPRDASLAAEWRENNMKPKIPTKRELELGVKTCTKCKEEKELLSFFRNAVQNDAYNRGRRNICKNCMYPARREKIKPYHIYEDIASIPLVNAKNEIVGFTIIDSEDVKKIMSISKYWNNHRGYAVSGIKSESLHRLLLGITDSKFVTDHINHNTLDNRKCNLRKATHSENMWNRKLNTNNTSGYKGVSFYKDSKKWGANINQNNFHRFLGLFETPEAAASAYDKAAKELHGDFYYNPSTLDGRSKPPKGD